MLLTGKTIVVSGVGPGLGQAIARIAAQEGASVVLAARNRGFLDSVRAQIEAEGGTAIVAPCDIGVEEDCARLADTVARSLGDRIHGLVNSAYAHGEWSTVDNADTADFAHSFDVNCLGTLRLTRACRSHLSNGGAVVNVSTMATVRPFGSEHGLEMGYAISKGALNTLGKYMAADLGRYGIRVNTVRMGWIHGAPVRQFIEDQVAGGAREDDVIATITKEIPLGIIPPEEDCARAVLMLLSDHARAVTGASLDVNGGHWMAP